MENSSKALIMAGGVLISISIISMAVYMYVTAQGLAQVNEDAMTVSQIESFNRFYTAYMTTRAGVSSISCVDGVNILNRALEDEVGIIENSSHITLSGDYYVADSADYITVDVNYSVTFDNKGKVSGVAITD